MGAAAGYHGGPEDKEPLPKRLRDVQKERVIMIERGSDLCDNVGLAYIDYMGIEKGRYKMYYMRIENEQRIMYNSRLGLLGSSSAFSVNNVVSSTADQAKSLTNLKNTEIPRKDQPLKIDVGFNDSSELDSMILMGQMGGVERGGLSNTQSMHSSDQT